MNKNKKFDSLKMKQQIQQKIYAETKNMNWEEERDYYEKAIQASPLAEKWNQIKARQDKRLNNKKKKAS